MLSCRLGHALTTFRKRYHGFVITSDDGHYNANGAVELRVGYINTIEDVVSTCRLVYDLGLSCTSNQVIVGQLVKIASQHDVGSWELATDLLHAFLNVVQKLFRLVNRAWWMVKTRNKKTATNTHPVKLIHSIVIGRNPYRRLNVSPHIEGDVSTLSTFSVSS